MTVPGQRACREPAHTLSRRCHLATQAAPRGAFPAQSLPPAPDPDLGAHPTPFPDTQPLLPVNPPWLRPHHLPWPAPSPVSWSCPARNLQASAQGRPVPASVRVRTLRLAPSETRVLQGSTQRAPLPRRPPGPSSPPRSRPQTAGPSTACPIPGAGADPSRPLSRSPFPGRREEGRGPSDGPGAGGEEPRPSAHRPIAPRAALPRRLLVTTWPGPVSCGRAARAAPRGDPRTQPQRPRGLGQGLRAGDPFRGRARRGGGKTRPWPRPDPPPPPRGRPATCCCGSARGEGLGLGGHAGSLGPGPGSGPGCGAAGGGTPAASPGADAVPARAVRPPRRSQSCEHEKREPRRRALAAALGRRRSGRTKATGGGRRPLLPWPRALRPPRARVKETRRTLSEMVSGQTWEATAHGAGGPQGRRERGLPPPRVDAPGGGGA